MTGKIYRRYCHDYEEQWIVARTYGWENNREMLEWADENCKKNQSVPSSR